MNANKLSILAALTFGLGGSLVAPQVAQAGDVERAEHRRLSEEMTRLAARGAWQGVNDRFEEMLELEKKGEVITYEEWFLGAQAAQNLGRMAATRFRLEGAIAQDPRDEATSWLAAIDASYGPVNLRSLDKESVATLTPKAMPFVPDQRLAIEFAQKQLEQSRSFKGLLPAGAYTLEAGGVTQQFTVEPGDGEHMQVKLSPGGGDSGGSALAYVGPRLDVGAAYTVGGAPKDDGLVGPPSFSGGGARLGVGVELGLKRGFGVIAQVGYHNLYSPSDREDLVGVPNQADSMHLGYGMVGPSARFGDIWVHAGGVLAFGVANASGVVDVDQINSQCPYGVDDSSCAWVSGVEEEHREYFPWTTSLTTSGVQAGVGYALFDIGEGLQAGLGLTGGVLFDPSRSYPWGQLAFTVGPASSRS
ncbi:MAG: hypothetical protein VX899_00235 [Myxococcota bacterium]|nr:hypothetical protein [Myxococcota bacterium]